MPKHYKILLIGPWDPWEREFIPLEPTYRPHVLVKGKIDYLGVTFRALDDEKRLFARRTAEVHMLPSYPSLVDYSDLQPGAEFEVLEGSHVVATGKVLEIIDA